MTLSIYRISGAGLGRLRVWLLTSVALMVLPLAGQSDVPGSSDPIAFNRFPHAQIISYSADETPVAHEFIVSHVEKIRRELKVEEQVRVEAREVRAIYSMPAGTPLDDVIAHYSASVSAGDVLFSCRGRDCGRSAQWANQVFGDAMLYGPDAGQFYLAGKRPEGLLSIYVIERGNRRINVLLRLLQTDTAVAVRSAPRLVETLGSRGHVIVNGVVPSVDGSLPATADPVLKGIAPHLERLREPQVYVVCHLYAPGSVDKVIERSTRCARSVVEKLALSSGPALVPFGAGPLLPRDERLGRIELVLPHGGSRD